MIFDMTTKKILSFTSIAAASIAIVAGLNFSSEKGDYQPRLATVKQTNSSFQDANAYRNLLKQDAISGKVEFGKIAKESKRIQEIKENNPFYRAGGLEWSEEGPYNRAGRTRSITIDPNNSSIMYSGSVTGGLFKSTDKGNTWSKITSLTDGNAISSIEVLTNGYIYVATGCTFEGGQRGISNANTHSYGSGLFVSKDNGVSWNLIPGTQPTEFATGDWSQINRIVKSQDESEIFVAGDLGGSFPVAKIDVASDAISYISGISGTIGWDIVTAGDGTIYTATNTRIIFKSTDGETFSNVHSIQAPQQPDLQVTRVVLATAPSNPDYVYAVDVKSNSSSVTGVMQSLLISQDAGQTWSRKIYDYPYESDPTTSASGDYSQGQYDLCLTVSPIDENVAFVGGIRLFKYDKGGWEEVANTSNQGAFNYVHADIHSFTWADNAVLWVGTDGGIFRSTSFGAAYENYSRKFNTTQFYRIDIGLNDVAMGGTQDNGAQMFRRLENGYNDTYEETGGDGGSVDISRYNDNYRLSASQFNNIVRRTFSNLAYENLPFQGVMQGPFVSQFTVGENGNDLLTKDTVFFTLTDSDTIFPGETIEYTGNVVTGSKQEYTLPAGDSVILARNSQGEIIRKDTLVLKDKVQNILAIGGYNVIFFTRDHYNYSKTTDYVLDTNTVPNGPEKFGPTNENMLWFRLNYTDVAAVNYMEFSDDSYTLFFGTEDGSLYKVSGLDSLYRDNMTSNLNNQFNQYTLNNESF